MRELRDLLPDEFVRDASALLQAARDVVLRNGIELTLGAEQSLGLETATAFDVIRDNICHPCRRIRPRPVQSF